MVPSLSQPTKQARGGVRRVAWQRAVLSAHGASVVDLIAPASLAPLLAVVGVEIPARRKLARWCIGLEGNVLAGQVGNLTRWAVDQPPARDTVRLGEVESALYDRLRWARDLVKRRLGLAGPIVGLAGLDALTKMLQELRYNVLYATCLEVVLELEDL